MNFLPSIKFLQQRLGLVPKAADVSLVLWLVPGPAAEEAMGLVRQVAATLPRLPIFVLSAVPLRGCDDFIRIPPPFRFLGAPRRLLRKLRTRVLVVVGSHDAPRSLIDQARARGVAIVGLPSSTGADGEAARGRASTIAPIVELLHQTNHQRLRGGFSASATVAPRGTWIRRLIPDPVEWTSLESIAAVLGRPRSILCLGNGPSSVRPDLADVPFDCLFRVNWSWLPGGRHSRPDLVFTALQTTLRRVPAARGFIFKDRATADRILGHRPLRRAPVRFGVAEHLDLYDPESLGPYTLTNGALMLALAVALEPERLIIAGVDLFSDPAGAYPNGPDVANDYTAGHSRDLERAFLCSVLCRYRGALDVRSPMLAAALQEWRKDR